MGFCSCTYSFFKLRTSSQLPGPANYAMHSFVLQSLGAICLLIAATETFTFVANVESTRRFGDILIVSGTVILIFHVAVSREASLISIFTKKDMKLARAKFIYTAHEMNRTAASKDAKKKKDPEPDINVDVVVVGAGPVSRSFVFCLENTHHCLLAFSSLENISSSRWDWAWPTLWGSLGSG